MPNLFAITSEPIAPQLHIIAIDQPERIVAVQRVTLIGRAPDNDLVLEEATISRCHALLLRDTEEVLLVDLESTNGTWVNGVCVSPEAPVRLVDGDVIWLGQVVVRYAGAPAQRT